MILTAIWYLLKAAVAMVFVFGCWHLLMWYNHSELETAFQNKFGDTKIGFVIMALMLLGGFFFVGFGLSVIQEGMFTVDD